jgi:hypothetical protein
MPSNFFHIWLGAMLIVFPAALLIRTMRGRKTLNVEAFIVAGFTLGGAITLIKILIKLLTQEKLQTDLEFDGSMGLFLGSSAGIYVALKEVYIKLFLE